MISWEFHKKELRNMLAKNLEIMWDKQVQSILIITSNQ